MRKSLSSITTKQLTKLMQLIDQGQLTAVLQWLEDHQHQTGFNLNQAIHYRQYHLQPFQYFLIKYPRPLHDPIARQILLKFCTLLRTDLAADFKTATEVLTPQQALMGINSIEYFDTLLETKSELLLSIAANGDNFLHVLAKVTKPNIEKIIFTLYQMGVDVNKKNNESYTPALIAVKSDNLPALKSLVVCKANLELTYDDANLLEIAGIDEHKAIYDFLSIQCERKKIKLQQNILFFIYASTGQLEKLKQIREKISHINWQSPGDKRTFLIEAIIEDKIPVVKYLLEQKADPNIVDAKGHNALISAVANHNEIALRHVLKSKVAIDLYYRELTKQFTVLNMAAEYNLVNMVKLLLDAKMDPNVAAEDSTTPLASAIALRHLEMMPLFLNHPKIDLGLSVGSEQDLYIQLAVKSDCAESVRLLLESKKIDLTVFNGKRHLSLANSDHDIFKLLVGHGLDLNLSLINKIKGALLYLVIFEKKTLIKWLLARKADFIEIEQIQEALLHAILFIKNKNMVKLLLATFMPRLSRPFTMCLVEIFIKLNWFDLLFKIQSDIKLFMSSPVLRQYAGEKDRLFFVAGMIEYLNSQEMEFNLFAKTIEAFDFRQQKCFIRIPLYFLHMLSLAPGLAPCLTMGKHDTSGLIEFLFPVKVAAQLLSTQTSEVKICVGMQPHAFFKERGHEIEFKRLFKEARIKKKAVSRRSFLTSENISKPIAPCHWFDGLLSADDPRLFMVDDRSKANVRLLIPPALCENKFLDKDRWHFHNENGLKVLKGDFPVKVSMCIAEKNYSAKVYFTHEITVPHTADRMLCFQLPACQGQGILYVAAYLLKNGFHVSKPHLPKSIRLKIPARSSSDTKDSLSYQNP